MRKFGNVIFLLFMISACTGDSVKEESSSRQLSESLGSGDLSSFEKADKPREFSFPEDHGPHRSFKTEWWYVTGNLADNTGKEYGYQFTIFRIGNSPSEAETVENTWRSNEFYMGHFTLTDVASKNFYHDEQFSRGSIGNAGSTEKRTWLNAMEVQFLRSSSGKDSLIVNAKMEEVELMLSMVSLKNPVLQGDNGLSQKGSKEGNASYYYSLTRLETVGNITVNGDKFSVNGNSWLDREWSTSMLESNQSGWDWFSLQLNEGYEIMYYQLRNLDQEPGPTSAGVLVFPDGSKKRISYKEVNLEVLEKWTSPKSSDTYPSGWKMTILDEIEIFILPKIKNQELDAAVRYWEGAVEIEGNWKGTRNTNVSGSGYVELTGYSN